MATMAMATALKNNKLALAIACILASANSIAGELKLEPSITVEETFTDNVSLTKDDEESSLVSQIGVLIEEEYLSKNAELNISLHSKYAIYSHDSELNNDYHTVEADGRFELWPNGIAIVGNASIKNEARNTLDNSLADIVSADTVQVQRYNGGLQYETNNSQYLIQSIVGYSTTIAEDNIGEQEGITATIYSRNGAQSNWIFWDASGSFQEIENRSQDGQMSDFELKIGSRTPYKITPFFRLYHEENTGNINQGNRDLQSSSYGAGLRWLVNPRFYIDVSYNKPKDDQLDLDGNLLEEYVDASVRWQPTSRTLLEANFSQRFYGNSYNFSLAHQNRRLTNAIKYDERVLAFTRERYDPISQGIFYCPPDTTQPSDCFAQEGTVIGPDSDLVLRELFNYDILEDDEFSLNKTLEWKSELALPRTTLTFSARGNQRRSLDTNIEDETFNATFSINRKLSGYSNLNLTSVFQQNDYRIGEENERNDKYTKYSAEYIRTLNSTLNATFGISHLDRDSSEQRFTYQEGRVYLQVKKGF